MDSEAASNRSILGIAGLASLCCVGPGALAVTGGVAAGGLGATFAQALVTVVTLAVIGLVLRWRRGCSNCPTETP